jgi:ABC-type Mn2+/Zn2+ transport system permease subunit/Mn-dependent DtxR family transcriptional regulator
MDFLEILQQEWAIRALIASSLVGLMCGVLGCFIVLRNMSLVGDALAHAILPGVVLAFVVVGYSELGFFTGAVLAGLITAVGITWIQHNVKTKNDAAIGIVFTAMFSIGVMGISYISKNEGVHLDLKDFLFGNVLGVSNSDLYLTAGVTVYVVLSVIVFYRYLFVSTFQAVIAQTMGISVQMVHYFLMLLLSFAVVASLQTVGVILVVAMLITPASTALLLSNRLPRVLVLAGGIGLFSAVLGLFLAIQLETTPGPAMAVTATLIYLVAVFFAPQKGLVFKSAQKRKLKRRILMEDIIKRSFHLQNSGRLSLDQLSQQLELPERSISRTLKQLSKQQFFELDPNKIALTGRGQELARRLVRAHRLWETYLVDKMGMDTDHIHDEAEHFEHLLTDEMLDEVDAELGFPELDPHGSPIPSKLGLPKFPLSRLRPKESAKIASKQINEHITAELWKLGLLPDTAVDMVENEGKEIQVRTGDRIINLSRDLARQVNVDGSMV